MNARQLLAEVRRRPLLVIGGLVALFAIANLSDLFARGQSDDAAPSADPDADQAAADDATIGADPAGFYAPSYQYPSYDPFGTDLGTTQPVIDYSPEGCPLPRPAAPELYKGQGEYKCDAATKQWVWAWHPAKVNAKGCLLPKPAVPAQYQGKGDWTCDAATKQWVWKWKDQTPPPEKKPGRLVLKAGTHRTWKVNTDVTPKRASDPRQWQHGALTVETGPKQAVRRPDGQTVDMVRIRSGGQAGRWIGVVTGTWTAPTGGG